MCFKELKIDLSKGSTNAVIDVLEYLAIRLNESKDLIDLATTFVSEARRLLEARPASGLIFNAI